MSNKTSEEVITLSIPVRESNYTRCPTSADEFGSKNDMTRPTRPCAKMLEAFNLGRIQSINLDTDLTQESFDDNSIENHMFEFDAFMTISNADGASAIVTDTQFEQWFEWAPENYTLWTMRSGTASVCKTWLKYVDSRKADYDTYLKLKEEFE